MVGLVLFGCLNDELQFLWSLCPSKRGAVFIVVLDKFDEEIL
jgi:hypothetical protein